MLLYNILYCLCNIYNIIWRVCPAACGGAGRASCATIYNIYNMIYNIFYNIIIQYCAAACGGAGRGDCEPAVRRYNIYII